MRDTWQYLVSVLVTSSVYLTQIYIIKNVKRTLFSITFCWKCEQEDGWPVSHWAAQPPCLQDISERQQVFEAALKVSVSGPNSVIWCSFTATTSSNNQIYGFSRVAKKLSLSSKKSVHHFLLFSVKALELSTFRCLFICTRYHFLILLASTDHSTIKMLPQDICTNSLLYKIKLKDSLVCLFLWKCWSNNFICFCHICSEL